MRTRRIAILIDGGFFVKRLPKMQGWNKPNLSPQDIAEAARIIGKRHVQRLIGEAEDVKHSQWPNHTYRQPHPQKAG